MRFYANSKITKFTWLHCIITAGTPSSVTLPGFLKTRQPTKHSSVTLIWLSAIFLTKAGSVAQVIPTTDGLTSYAGTTTTRHQLTCGEDPPHVVIREWRYGPRRLRVNDDDHDYIIWHILTFANVDIDVWLSCCMKVLLMLSNIEWIAEERRIDCWPETEINRRWYGRLKWYFIVNKIYYWLCSVNAVNWLVRVRTPSIFVYLY